MEKIVPAGGFGNLNHRGSPDPEALEGSVVEKLAAAGGSGNLNHRGSPDPEALEGSVMERLAAAGGFGSLNHRGSPDPEALEGSVMEKIVPAGGVLLFTDSQNPGQFIHILSPFYQDSPHTQGQRNGQVNVVPVSHGNTLFRA